MVAGHQGCPHQDAVAVAATGPEVKRIEAGPDTPAARPYAPLQPAPETADRCSDRILRVSPKGHPKPLGSNESCRPRRRRGRPRPIAACDPCGEVQHVGARMPMETAVAATVSGDGKRQRGNEFDAGAPAFGDILAVSGDPKPTGAVSSVMVIILVAIVVSLGVESIRCCRRIARDAGADPAGLGRSF